MLTVCIQAGGASSRMGEDKALKTFLERPLIQRVIERLLPVADEIIVTTNRPEDYAFLATDSEVALWRHDDIPRLRTLRLVSDLKPGRGALGGLYTAIASASHPIVAVVACDMPFASAALLEAASQLLVEEEADVVIPRIEIEQTGKGSEGYEPLHAVYRRETCLPAIESAINADQWKVIAWFPQVKIRVLIPDEIQRYDPSGLAFWNVNTPEEFAQAEQIATSR